MPSTEEIKIKISAEDKASGVLSKLGSTAGSLGGVLGNLAKVAGVGVVAGFGAMTAFGISSISAFIDAEKQMANATNSLQNTFNNLTKNEVNTLKVDLESTTVSFEQIKDAMNQAGSAAVKLAFDDEEASSAFAKLFSVTKGVTSAQEELAIAMDLAAFSGQSLESATDALVKVHAGGTRVLKEFGIEVKEGTTSAEALAIVQQKVAGSAETMANTTAGKLQVLSLSWENLKETVGGALAQAITPFIDKLVTWAQSPETQQKIQEIADKVAIFAKQVTPVVQQLLPALETGFKLALAAAMALGKFLFVDIPNAVAAVTVKFIEITSAIEIFIMRVKDAIREARELISNVGSGIGNAAANVGNAIVPFGNPFGKKQFGGQVQANKSFLVGERGPELFVPGQNGAIVPNRALGGGGIVVNITGTFLSEDAAEAMANKMIDLLKLEVRM